MLISTRGRYALMVLMSLSETEEGAYVPLKDIVQQLDISQKYLESIMTSLSKGGLVDSVHGKGGGYRLNRKPDRYTLGEILRLAEGDLAPVACLVQDAKPCERAGECNMRPVWTKLESMVNDFLDGITLEDMINGLE